jgi:hypothetical protein|tara:strand:+ start:48 stop:353 length:306 start_codon:yes stop_codon:yes gene_type:complete
MATKKVTKTIEVQEEIEIVPVIAGAIYSFIGKSGESEEALCLATRKKGAEATKGLFRTFGEAEAWYVEGDESLLHWKIACKPVRVEVPKKAVRKRTIKSKE